MLCDVVIFILKLCKTLSSGLPSSGKDFVDCVFPLRTDFSNILFVDVPSKPRAKEEIFNQNGNTENFQGARFFFDYVMQARFCIHCYYLFKKNISSLTVPLKQGWSNWNKNKNLRFSLLSYQNVLFCCQRSSLQIKKWNLNIIYFGNDAIKVFCEGGRIQTKLSAFFVLFVL